MTEIAVTEIHFREILDGVRDIVSSLPDLIAECKNQEERLALIRAHQEFEELLSRMMSRHQEDLNIPANDLIRGLLIRLTEVQGQVKGRPVDLIDVGALLRDLDTIHNAILRSSITAMEPAGAPEEARSRPDDTGIIAISPRGRAAPPPAPQPSKEPHAEVKAPRKAEPAPALPSMEPHTEMSAPTKVQPPPPMGASPASIVTRGVGAVRDILGKVWRRSRKGVEETPPKRQVVNTGFAPQTDPDHAIDKRMSLKTGESYYFWLDIGEPRKESIDKTPAALPPVPANARLTVALFGFQDGLLLTPRADVGEMEVREDGTVKVVAQPLANSPPQSLLLDHCLFFPVRCPADEGTFRMRCNIYWGQILLQSRVVYAQVMTVPKRLPDGEWALRSVLDYTLSQRLDPALLTELPEHRLSILLNSNDDGTNSIHIYGAKGEEKFKQDDVRFDAMKLSKWIERGRGSLRKASWNSLEEWKEGTPFIYQDKKRDLTRLSRDLISMAQWGRELYTQFKVRTTFEEVLFEPSYIQIAMKDSPTQVLPGAMIYDYPLLVGHADGTPDITLCQSFVRALNEERPLNEHECFMGNCPSRNDERTVCPSGFWGFRHYLGTPLSIEEKKNDKEEEGERRDGKIAVNIPFAHQVKMVFAAAKDFRLLEAHKKTLEEDKELKPWLILEWADNRDAVLTLLKLSPHLVYFYCHGALLRDEPGYLVVGDHDEIYPSNFDDIRWNSPRPLIFMNGCHTVDPLAALDFIEPLVRLSKCAGVIGTEITIYEEMATTFGEEFFRRFLGKGEGGERQERETVGMAVRNARLKLLKEGNPLGLVYIPYVIAGLRVVEQSAGPGG